MQTQFLLTALVCCFLWSSGQAQRTLTLHLDGEEVEVSQELDERYFGDYLSLDGAAQFRFRLHVELGQSYYWPQTEVAPDQYEWVPEDKVPIRWGLLLENGEIAQAEVTEFESGQLKQYPALLFVYEKEGEQKSLLLNLYEKNGEITLGHAVKMNDMAQHD